MEDEVHGLKGWAKQVPTDQLRASLQGDQIATLDHWWIKMDGAAVLIADIDENGHATNLSVLVSEADSDTMDTFSLSMITLADIPGVPPAKKSFPWMTHELVVHTIDKSKISEFRAPPWPTMSPHNIGVQFQVNSDAQAIELVDFIIKAIVDGVLPPEVQMYIPKENKMMTALPLYEVWQDTVRKTAEHIRTGGTHEEPVDRS